MPASRAHRTRSSLRTLSAHGASTCRNGSGAPGRKSYGSRRWDCSARSCETKYLEFFHHPAAHGDSITDGEAGAVPAAHELALAVVHADLDLVVAAAETLGHFR